MRRERKRKEQEEKEEKRNGASNGERSASERGRGFFVGKEAHVDAVAARVKSRVARILWDGKVARKSREMFVK